MPTHATYLLLLAVAVYGLILLVEAFREGFSRRWGLEVGFLATAVVMLHLTTGFPGASGRQAFGGAADLGLAVMLLVAVCAGTVAQYFFYLEGRFRWRSLLKPLCVSPMLLIPMVGIFPFGAQMTTAQYISFALLAFQNGFFWRAVFERTKRGA